MQSWAHLTLKSLFVLERTLLLGAMALNKKKSEERRATSKLTKSNFEGFAHEQYNEKRVQ